MTLPKSILIRPLTVPVHAEVSIPGSKSLTHRSLILAALSTGTTQLQGALWAEDTEFMVKALQKLGFHIKEKPDPSNMSNRQITIDGLSGVIPAKEAELYVGTAGTAARLLTAFCALGNGSYRIHGTERMHQRPMKEIFDALRKLGAKVDDQNGFLPATISGPITGGKVSVADTESSQFGSALILVSKANPKIEVSCPSSPYVEMTRHLLQSWPNGKSRTIQIEPDASSASYFLCLQRLHGGNMNIAGWNTHSTQMDSRIADNQIWEKLLAANDSASTAVFSRKKDLGDAMLTLAVTAAGLKKHYHLIEAANLRKQECDRIHALRVELEKCGVPAQEFEDELMLSPAKNFRKATIRTYDDHRIAMCFAMLGTIDAFEDGTPWITIEDPSCVAKSFPNFFETLESIARQSYAHAGKPFRPIVLQENQAPLFTI